MNLVQDGRAVYTIVVSDGRAELAMSAATMLLEKVEKASGAKLAIVEETQVPASPMVYIGRARAAEKPGPNVAAMQGSDVRRRAGAVVDLGRFVITTKYESYRVPTDTPCLSFYTVTVVILYLAIVCGTAVDQAPTAFIC